MASAGDHIRTAQGHVEMQVYLAFLAGDRSAQAGDFHGFVEFLPGENLGVHIVHTHHRVIHRPQRLHRGQTDTLLFAKSRKT